MNFINLAPGDAIFVDANTLTYHFEPHALCQQIGLLTNDALIVAVMQANRLNRIASNDTDFDRVPGITRYAPV